MKKSFALEEELTSYLLPKKNLLAFSAGIDSSALFFLLIKNNVSFDIAIVDYGMRPESKDEVAHAQALANQYGIKCHTIKAPIFESNFESQARTFRYTWFESLIAEHGYETLLTAHQLNDQLEWFLMRLSRGAGLDELIGMEPIQNRSGYTLVRPLLGFSKAELLGYLMEHNHPYFIDESNQDERFERNRFRKHFSDPLIEQYGEGIARSFDYLRHDHALLATGFREIYHHKQLRILHLDNPRYASKAADKTLKYLGYLLSAAQREAIANNASIIVGRKWVVTYKDCLLWVAPYVTVTMPKTFKEQCRRLNIPQKIRPYLYQEEIDPDAVATGILA